MLELRRNVRFCINPNGLTQGGGSRADNSFAAHPSMRGLGRFYEMEVTCLGEADPLTGYFVNIKEIDRAVRGAAVPIIDEMCRLAPQTEPALVLGRVLGPLNGALRGSVRSVRWRLTPYYSIEMSTPRSDHVLIRQQFEFAASHRLHCPSMSAEANREIFGKCNNPHGHGHNYRVEPCVQTTLTPQGPGMTLERLEALTAALIVERFDHKHLNDDTREFAAATGVNPSVENIAKVCFDLLGPAVKSEPGGSTLRSVTVWETDKTSCTYPA